MGAWSSSWFRKKIKRKLRCQKEQARPQFSKYRLQNATDCVRQGQSGFLLYWSGYDRAINNIITLGQKTASWSGENRILQMERYEASRVGADTSCRYHRPSSTPSTATHSIIFANQYCVKLRVNEGIPYQNWSIGPTILQTVPAIHIKTKLFIRPFCRKNLQQHASDQKITMHRKYSIMKYYVYYLSCKNSPFVYKDFPWCSTCYWSGLRSGPAVPSSTTSSNCDWCISHQDNS